MDPSSEAKTPSLYRLHTKEAPPESNSARRKTLTCRFMGLSTMYNWAYTPACDSGNPYKASQEYYKFHLHDKPSYK